MAVDLGTAYISLVPTTKDFDKGIKSALDASVKHADKAGQKMGDSLAASMDKHGSKVGDAFGRSFTPKVQGAGKNALQGLAQAMLGGAEGIGSQVGGKFSGGLASAISKGADGAVSALEKIGSSGDGIASKLSTTGMVAAGGVALIGTAAIAAGKELYKIGETWDAVADGITFKTGLVGEQLDAVKNSVKNVAKDTAAEIGDIANVAAALVKGFHIDPKTSGFEELTQQISQYNAAAKENGEATVDMRSFVMAMNNMKLGSNPKAMFDMFNKLYGVTTQTTLPMNDLLDTLKRFGPQLQQFKIPVADGVQIIAAMAQSGVDADTAIRGFSTAWGKLKDSPDPSGALREAIKQIRDGLQSTDDKTRETAQRMATEFFGNKAGPALAKAIGDGNLELDNFNTKAAKTGQTVGDMTKATEDFAQEWKKFKNFLTSDLEPAATAVFGGINNLLTSTLGVFAKNIEDIRNALKDPVFGGNPGAMPGMAPGPEAAAGILGGAAGTGPGIGANGASGGNAAASILGGMAGAKSGFAAGVGGGGRGYMNYGKTSAALDQQAGPVERWRPAVRAALSAYGPKYGITNTSAWESAMMRQIATESGGNPSAWNNYDSNAQAGHPSRGLLQFIPGTFGQYNITGGDIMDPQAQIAAFIPYVMSRYGVDRNGSPLQVGRGVGYDTGGFLPPGTTIVKNDTGKPELVLNPDQQQALADSGVDPNSLLHGTGGGAAPGPAIDPTAILHGASGGAAPGPTPGGSDQPNYGMDFVRSLGFIPATAGSTAKSGTSSLASFIDMGSSVVGGLIDTGVNLGNMAISAAIAAGAASGSFGSAAAAAPAAQMAASYGLQLLGNQGKTIANYWFGLAGIGADALVEQLSPFGIPRWLGYDYTQYAPQLGIQQAALSTVEKMGKDAIGQAINPQQQPGAPGAPMNPAGPVTPSTMPGASQPLQQPSQPEGTPPPPPPPPGDPSQLLPKLPIPGLFDNGGMLPPGGMGINLTNRPEPVLTAQQWDAIAATSAEPARNTPLVQNLYAQDMQDAIRQLEKVKRRDMMQYAGRP